VRYNISGTAAPEIDYDPIPDSIIIEAGSTTATIDITPVDDSLAENDETISISLISNADYIVSASDLATVTIESDELLSDLVVSSLSAPTTAGAGQSFSVTDTTKNQGGGSTDPSLTQFYLSTNSAIDASDILIGSRSIPALLAGATSSGSTTITIPADTVTGLWYIIAKADGEGVVVETSEPNNNYSRTIRIK
jgi:subtilase family serine protease